MNKQIKMLQKKVVSDIILLIFNLHETDFIVLISHVLNVGKQWN